jgi:poly(3-hydroxybutyrate) depolymerase
VQLFDALVKEIGARYCIDQNRVFATGFSYGGSMANSLGCFRGTALRAIAPQAGGNLWPASVPCRGQVPVWTAYGLQDPYLGPYERPSRDFWLSSNHCGASAFPVSPDPCMTYAGCDRGFPVISCEWAGGHAWAPFGDIGVWDFFASFR